MDKKNGIKKKWDQEKIDAFLKYIAEKFKKSENQSKNREYLSLFVHLLNNDTFKQKLPKCQSHSKVSLVLESLLSSELTVDELLLLGRSLCKQLFYSDLLAQLILVLFQKHVTGNEGVLEFLKTVWFDREIVCELPSTWLLYLNTWPSYLETHVFNILESTKSTSDVNVSTLQINNIWNQCDNHFLIKMCCRQDRVFQCVCQILNAMLVSRACHRVLVHFIRQFITSVKDYCRRSNIDIVDLYPRSVQSVVMCCTLDLYSNLPQFVEKLSPDWKFILSTHFPQLTSILLQENI